MVAVFHLAHGPFQRDDGLLRIGDDGRQQMRNAVIDGELEHLRIDHDQAALFRRQPVEQRQDHRVDGDRLARAGGAGDQQMRHLGEIGDDRLAADRLAERHGKLGLAGLEVTGADQFAEIDGLAALVRQFDADDVAAGHDGDAGGDRAHRAGDIVGKADDAGGLDAGRRLQFIERDDGAGADMDDLALDAEILQHAFEHAGILFQRVGRQGRVAHDILRFGEEMQRRQNEIVVVRDEGALRFAFDALAGLRTRGGGNDACAGLSRWLLAWCGHRCPIGSGIDLVVLVVFRHDAGRQVAAVEEILVIIVDRHGRCGDDAALAAVERGLDPLRASNSLRARPVRSACRIRPC